VEILQRLSDQPGLGVSELAARQHLATNTVSSLVQQMVTSDLVDRVPRPGDRRAVTLQLTQAGAALLAAWQDANDRRLSRAMTQLPARHRNAIEGAVPALAALAVLLESDEEQQKGPARGPGAPAGGQS
jgi:DNA-binding MarR family transcriptional regulator